MKRFKVTVTTAADGTAFAHTPRFSGKVHQVEYVKAGANGFEDGVDVAISGEATAVSIWAEQNVNASAVRAPRQPVHSPAGAPALYADGGTAVVEPIALANDRVRISIAQAGAEKTGTFHVLVD